MLFHLQSWKQKSAIWDKVRLTFSSRSDYRKSLPGQFIRICLKLEQNCRLFLDIFNGVIMNDLFMTFTSRLKVDAKCVYQQWNWITVVNYFGTPPADWMHGYLYFEPGAWIWTKGFRRYLLIVKKLIWKIFFKFKQGTCPSMAFAWNFFGIFMIFLGGSVGQIIYREYIVFRGSNISCSLACITRGTIVYSSWDQCAKLMVLWNVTSGTHCVYN